MRRKLGILGIVLGAALPAASTGCKPVSEQMAVAIVRHVNVEGGCWVLDVVGGTLEPINLGAEFQKDGMPVRVDYEEVHDMKSTCQVGKLIRIVNIRASR